MKISIKSKKYISLFLTLFICFGILNIFSAENKISANNDSKINALESRIDQLEKEQDQAQKQIDSYSNKIEDEKKKQEALNKQQQAAREQVALYEEKVNLVLDEISINEKDIKEKKKEIKYNTNLFLKRMRAMYMAPQSSSPLAVLLGATDLADFLTKSEVLKRVSEHDTILIEDLKNEKIELDLLSQELTDKKVVLNNTKQKYSAKAKKLESEYQKSKDSEEELAKNQQKYIENKKKYKKEIEQAEGAIEKRLEEIRLAQLEQKNPTKRPEGKFSWPVPGYARISSGYGNRIIFGYKEFHYGIDIPAPYGTTIVAAHNGKVVLAGYNYSYGNYVVIDHGGGLVTLYAHNTSLVVSEGQQVVRGQKIANMGSTGFSTGSHSHFEVRVNGAKVNPLGYVNPPY